MKEQNHIRKRVEYYDERIGYTFGLAYIPDEKESDGKGELDAQYQAEPNEDDVYVWWSRW